MCRQHVPLEALYLVVGGVKVPPKENLVSTVAILDFLSCHHHYKGVKDILINRGRLSVKQSTLKRTISK